MNKKLGAEYSLPLDPSVAPPSRNPVHAATQTDHPVNTVIPTVVAIPLVAVTPSITPAPAHSWADHRIYAPDTAPRSPLPPSPSATLHNSAQADATPAPVVPSSPPFSWADDSSPDLSRVPLLPPRNFSALRSDVSTSTPFSTLRYRVHRKQRSTRAPHFHASHSPLHRCPATFNAPSRSPASKVALAMTSTLDWDRDPRLSDLNHAVARPDARALSDAETVRGTVLGEGAGEGGAGTGFCHRAQWAKIAALVADSWLKMRHAKSRSSTAAAASAVNILATR
ncbi:hypothetical protein B0H14DRAFT_3709370 [Mycena olivaceomarginata]|nr:hypothetical protein B0H14DRAFT_3709370 [Mycena olivaceomarginata]